MADEDQMTVRERRAKHAREQARKDAPKNLARKAAVPVLLLLVAGAIAAGFYFTNKNAEACPGHFHATFGIFIPGDNGTFTKVDYARPRAPNGGAYYDFGNAPGFSLSTHMHQSGSEQGSLALGPSQLHFEPPVANSCVALEDVLDAIDVKASDSRLELRGGHAQVGQAGTWTSEDGPVHFYVQDEKGDWSESKYSDWEDKQVPDAWSFLLAIGEYDDAQIRQMQGTIPAPISRDPNFTGETGFNHSA